MNLLVCTKVFCVSTSQTFEKSTLFHEFVDGLVAKS